MIDYSKVVFDEIYNKIVSGTIEYPDSYTKNEKIDFIDRIIVMYNENNNFEKSDVLTKCKLKLMEE